MNVKELCCYPRPAFSTNTQNFTADNAWQNRARGDGQLSLVSDTLLPFITRTSLLQFASFVRNQDTVLEAVGQSCDLIDAVREAVGLPVI
eukprot:g3363.t1